MGRSCPWILGVVGRQKWAQACPLNITSCALPRKSCDYWIVSNYWAPGHAQLVNLVKKFLFYMRDDNRTWEIVNQIRNNQVSSIGDILGTPRHAQVHSGHAQLVNLGKKFLLCIRHDNRTWDLEKWIRYNRVSSIRSSWVLISVIWCSFQPIFSIVNTMNFGKYIIWHLQHVKNHIFGQLN